MDVAGLMIFAATRFLYGLIPGPNNAVVMARTIGGDTLGAAVFSAGLLIGNFVLLALVGSGLSIWFDEHPGVLAVIRWASTVYLVYLAWRMLRSARDGATAPKSQPGRMAQRCLPLLTGFAASLCNPQLLVFYALVLPEALDLRQIDPLAIVRLGCANMVAQVGVLGLLVMFSAQARRMVDVPGQRSALAAGSAVLMALAALLTATA